MPAYLHRITKAYRRSVSEVEADPINDIREPDLSAVVGFDSRYWTITGDVVTLMAPAERAAVDAAELEARRDGAVAQVDEAEDILRAVVLVIRDELNAHAAKINAILTAIDGNSTLATIRTAIAAIPDYPARTVADLRAAIRAKLGI